MKKIALNAAMAAMTKASTSDFLTGITENGDGVLISKENLATVLGGLIRVATGSQKGLMSGSDKSSIIQDYKENLLSVTFLVKNYSFLIVMTGNGVNSLYIAVDFSSDSFSARILLDNEIIRSGLTIKYKNRTFYFKREGVGFSVIPLRRTHFISIGSNIAPSDAITVNLK